MNVLASRALTRRQPRVGQSHRLGLLQHGSRSRSRSLSLTPAFSLTAALFTSIHAWSALSWPWSIPLTTVVLRSLATLPIALWQRRRLARQTRLRPLQEAWMLRIRDELALLHRRRGDGYEVFKTHYEEEVKKKWQDLDREWGVKRGRAQTAVLIGLPVVVQVPLFLLASLTLRAMTGQEFHLDGWGLEAHLGQDFLEPGFHGGEGWLQDLGRPDSTPLLAGLVGAANLMNIEARARTTASDTKTPASQLDRAVVLTSAMRFLAVLTIPLAAYAPASIALYWASSAVFSLAQNVLLARARDGGKDVEVEAAVAAVVRGGPKRTSERGEVERIDVKGTRSTHTQRDSERRGF